MEIYDKTTPNKGETNLEYTHRYHHFRFKNVSTRWVAYDNQLRIILITSTIQWTQISIFPKL